MGAIKINSNFVKPFIDSTIKTISVQCKLESKSRRPFFKGSQPQPPGEILGIVGLAGNGFTGCITISFGSKVYLRLMNGMLDDNRKELSSDVLDGAGELLNIIFSTARKILNDQGHQIQRAVPIVVKGSGMEILHLASNSIVVLPFETEDGDFHIEISAESYLS